MMNDNLPQEIWDDELITVKEPAADWLWHGFLAKGNITLLTGQWKAGKTTLLALLLSLRKQGGTLAGQAVTAGKTVVVTEESAPLWAERARQQDFGGQVCFMPRPFLRVPSPDQWQALIGRVLKLNLERGIDLVVLDPLAPLLSNENNARAVFNTLLPLGVLVRRGVAILALHHPAKGQAPADQAARGSGALLGHVDISMEMRHPGGNPHTRRRRLLALSRHAATPRQLLVELNPLGTAYDLVADDHQDEFQANWDVLRIVLEDAPQKLTREDILGEWPADFDKPCAKTLATWLERAAERLLIAREGSGRKADPFRYWLPAMVDVWRNEFPALYDMMEEQTKKRGIPFQSLTAKKRLGSEAESRGGTEYEETIEEFAPEAPPLTWPDDDCTAPSALHEPGAALPEPAATTPQAPPPAAEPTSPPKPVRLPYPWNIGKPEDVPEDVWQRARAAQGR